LRRRRLRERLYEVKIGRIWLVLWCAGMMVACSSETPEAPAEERVVRIAVFNVRELSTEKLHEVDDAGVGQNEQLLAAARIVQRVRPEVLVLQEIDHDYESVQQGLELNAGRFLTAYLGRGEAPIDYPFLFVEPCNTGILSGIDLDGDGVVAGAEHLNTRTFGGDCYGWGTYPGQYSMALFSQVPIVAEKARTFRKFLWKDLPGHHLPTDFYSAEAVEVLRLSSKSHWDVPVRVEERTLRLWISHPTPSGFDGDEDRNGRRNFDEIKFWVSYLEDEPALYDDRGAGGGYRAEHPFVILGDLNADPDQAFSLYDGMRPIEQLLRHPRIQDPTPSSRGAAATSASSEASHPERHTAVFRDGLRVDYVLPSAGLEVLDSGVFWPAAEEDPEGHELADRASDHRMVWVDVRF
jgi:endonuclease/exonuclease/phosphatase family metal-dependent hydrolase